jgi:hypothetical protein
MAKPVLPLDLVLSRDPSPPAEIGAPAPALFLGVPHFVAEIRTATKQWTAIATPDAQADFVSAWHVREITTASSTATMPVTATLGTLDAAGVSQDVTKALLRINRP